MVEHSYHNPKVRGSNPAIGMGIELLTQGDRISQKVAVTWIVITGKTERIFTVVSLSSLCLWVRPGAYPRLELLKGASFG